MKHAGNRKSKSFVLRAFKCPECGQRMNAPKGKGSEAGHIKDMWCPICMRVQKFQMYDYDRIYCG
jgi:uncharacterized protein YlaI